MTQKTHWYFGVGLLVALLAGAAAGVVASIAVGKSLGDYATALVLSHVPTVAPTGVSHADGGGDALSRVAATALRSVATVTPASIDARTTASWITEEDAVGYGVVVATDGWVLTTADVVGRVANPRTQLEVWVEGVRYTVTQVVDDALTDFVLLKIPASNLVPVAFGASNGVTSGATVYAAQGTRGIVPTSVTHVRAASAATALPAEMFAFVWSLATLPSVSSPVFSSAGEVLAMSTSASALPLHTGDAFVRSVLHSGEVTVAGLGVRVVDLALPLNIDETMSQGKHTGALVLSFARTSPAQSAGVEVGDIITAVDDVRIDDTTSLAEILRGYAPDDLATVTVVRNGVTERIDVHFGDYTSLVY